KCRNCEQRGHLSRDCPEGKDYDLITCHRCKMDRHESPNCPEPECFSCRVVGHLESVSTVLYLVAPKLIFERNALTPRTESSMSGALVSATLIGRQLAMMLVGQSMAMLAMLIMMVGIMVSNPVGKQAAQDGARTGRDD
ncbi:hypothetical protein BU23DRAFT_473536, partial [Bimuria novae-zelandiae CBS 107.79]